MYAALEWYRRATKAGLHPIVGMEAYLAEGKASVRDRKSITCSCSPRTSRATGTCFSWRQSESGRVLLPAPDRPRDAAAASEGLIATSACLGGPVANNILHDRS